MNVGDDVTINGTIIGFNHTISRYEVAIEEVIVRLNCGTQIRVKEKEINTIHPFQPKPEKDERKGT